MIKILDQIKDLRNIKPNKDWARAEREVLLSQITKQSSAQPRSFLVDGYYLLKSFIPGNLLQFLARPIGVFLIAVLIISGSGILSVSAAKNSLPGDLLYSIKLATEKVTVTLTKDEKKAEKHIEFAANRVQEIEEINLQEDNKEDKREKITVATEGLTKEMSKVKEVLETSRKNQDAKKAGEIVEAAKNVDRKAEEIKQKIEHSMITLASQDEEILQDLGEVEDLVDEILVVVVDVLVEKYDKGDVELNEKELVESITEIIQSIKENMTEINNKKQKIEKLAEEKWLDKENETTVNETTSDSNEVSLEGEIEAVEDEDKVKEEIDKQEIAEDAEEMSESQDDDEKIDQLVKEAEELVSQGDMTNAMNKIKQSKVLVKQIRKVARDIEIEKQEAEKEESVELAEETATESETVEINELNDEDSDIENGETEQEPSESEAASVISASSSVGVEQAEEASSANEVKNQEQAKY